MTAGSREPLAGIGPSAEQADATSGISYRKRHDPASPKRTGAAPVRAAWSLTEITLLLGVVVGAFLLKQAMLGSLVFETMRDADKVVAYGAIMAFYQGIHIVAIALLVHRKGYRIETAFGLRGLRRPPRELLANALLVGALLVVVRGVSTGWSMLLTSMGWTPPAASTDQLVAMFSAGLPGLLLTLTALVVFAPIAEELVFRGVVLGFLAPRMGPWAAIFVTAGLFAVIHMEPWVFVPTFVLASALGWLALARRSLAGAMVLHGLYNATALAAAYLVMAR